jgi:hypothetical protein
LFIAIRLQTLLIWKIIMTSIGNPMTLSHAEAVEEVKYLRAEVDRLRANARVYVLPVRVAPLIVEAVEELDVEPSEEFDTVNGRDAWQAGWDSAIAAVIAAIEGETK